MNNPFHAIPPLVDEARDGAPTPAAAGATDALRPNPVPRNLLANLNKYGVPAALLVALGWLCWPDPPKKHPLPAASSAVDPERIARESRLASDALKAAAGRDTVTGQDRQAATQGALSGSGAPPLTLESRHPGPESLHEGRYGVGYEVGYGNGYSPAGGSGSNASNAAHTAQPIGLTDARDAQRQAIDAQAIRLKRAEEVRAAPIDADGSVRLLDEETGRADANAVSLTPSEVTLQQALRAHDEHNGFTGGVLPPQEPRAGLDPSDQAGPAARNSNAAFLSARATQQSANPGGQPRFLEPDLAPDGPVLLQGTVIEATLNTAIDSSLPGDVLATVSSDVYDSVHSRDVLIPAGSRLIGQYNPDVRPGQARILLAMQRLILPDGSAISLAGAPALDLQGKSGVPGHVNDHFWQRFGSSLVLGAASLLLPSGQNSTSTSNQSGGVVTSGSVAATALTDTVRQSLERNRAIGPTLEQGAGLRFVFVVGRDMRLPPWPDHRQPGRQNHVR